jgi:hypothetical protein
MASSAPSVLAQLVALDTQRIGKLQGLHRRVHGVRHVAPHAVHAVAAPPALPAGDRLGVRVRLRGLMPPTKIRFIVPWLRRGDAIRRDWANALRTVSAIRCVLCVPRVTVVIRRATHALLYHHEDFAAAIFDRIHSETRWLLPEILLAGGKIECEAMPRTHQHVTVIIEGHLAGTG